MASQSSRLVLSITIALLSFILAADARLCNTFFVSYSFSTFENPNPNPNPNSPQFLTIFTQFDAIKPPLLFLDDQPVIRRPRFLPRSSQSSSSSSSSSSSVFSSLRDRTKDIISVVVALLFGVGCGFLTAATMYLAWSLFSNRFYDFHASYDSDDFDDDDDNGDASPRKDGYAKIPAADYAIAPAPAKAAA